MFCVLQCLTQILVTIPAAKSWRQSSISIVAHGFQGTVADVDAIAEEEEASDAEEDSSDVDEGDDDVPDVTKKFCQTWLSRNLENDFTTKLCRNKKMIFLTFSYVATSLRMRTRLTRMSRRCPLSPRETSRRECSRYIDKRSHSKLFTHDYEGSKPPNSILVVLFHSRLHCRWKTLTR